MTSRLEHMCDTVLNLESFTGSDKEKNPAFKEYHGERKRGERRKNKGQTFDDSSVLFLRASRLSLRIPILFGFVVLKSNCKTDGSVAGLFHIVKLPRLNSLQCHMPDTVDLAFKLKRKKFMIEVRVTRNVLRVSCWCDTCGVAVQKNLLSSPPKETWPQARRAEHVCRMYREVMSLSLAVGRSCAF